MAVVTLYFNQMPQLASLKQIQQPFIMLNPDCTVSYGTGSFGDEEVGGAGATIAPTASELQDLADAFARGAESLRTADKDNSEPAQVRSALLIAFEEGRRLKMSDVDITFEI